MKILFVEDLFTDVELARRALKKEHIEFIDKVVDTESEFRKALVEFQPDLIISDYSMPTFDGMRALLITRAQPVYIPVIIFTGSMNEETAVSCIKAGADDYVLKEKIKRLPFAVREVLEKVKTQREKELVEGERARLMSAVEQASEMFVITDLNGDILYVNPAFEQVTGYRRDEVLGKNPRILKSGVQDADFYREMWDSLTQGRIWRSRMINKRKNGSHYTEEMVISPVRDNSGQIIHYSAVKRDITSHLRDSEMLQQAQKMESVGRLAGGVAHDYNNMLSVILGYTELALNKVNPNDPLHDYLQQILTAARSSRDITRQLLAFARKQTISPKLLDLNETIEEGMLKMLRRLIGEDIDLAWLPKANLWPVKLDPSQLDQILANLCVNTRDAIAGVGKVTIETDKVIFDAAYCADHAGFVPGEFAMLAVSDNGCGMDKETLDKLFELFFTTKGVGKGTGLGLATVYGIVKQNDGFINVYSEPGKGTTFRIYLPRHAGEAEETSAESTAEIPKGRGETVLVVEDEASILKLASRILDGLGYNVLTAGTPSEAMGLAKEHADNINLLITDVVMPEMSGRDLVGRLHALCPGIKTLFMSGYTANVIAHRGVLDKGVNFIQKPFSTKDFAAKVRAALDTAKDSTHAY